MAECCHCANVPFAKCCTARWTLPAREPCRADKGSDGLIERLRQLSEQLRTLLRHVPAILQPDAELTGNIESGLVGETHAGGQRSSVTAYEEGVLVPIHSDAMARAMRQTRQRVIPAPTLALVKSTHSFVDVAYGHPDLGRLQRNLLPALHHIPHLALPRSGLTKHPGPGDIGLVAVECATGVDQYDRSFADGLHNLGAVWKGAGLIEKGE